MNVGQMISRLEKFDPRYAVRIVNPQEQDLLEVDAVNYIEGRGTVVIFTPDLEDPDG